MDLLVYKLIILKSIITFFYVFTLVIILTKIFPQYENKYNDLSITRIIYELLLETVLLFLIVFTSKCFVNLIIKYIMPTKTKNSGDLLLYISYSVIVSILFTTINKSYKNKILLIRDKLM